MVAGFGRGALGAIHRFCQDPCNGRFAGTTRAGEQYRMRQTSGTDCIGKRIGDVRLLNHLTKGLWTIFACKYEISHDRLSAVKGGQDLGGGERGIRTLGAAFNSTHDFQSCSFGQLGHLSVSSGCETFDHLEGLPGPVNHARWNEAPSETGGEGGIRTPDPIFTGCRFSRAEPSAARPPLLPS